jgi:hypothetical protein
VEPVDQTLNKTTYFQEYTTSRDQFRLDKSNNAFSKTASSSSSIVFSINRSKSYQTIIGFGGAITDATVKKKS